MSIEITNPLNGTNYATSKPVVAKLDNIRVMSGRISNEIGEIKQFEIESRLQINASSKAYNSIIKRSFDILFSVTALLILLPFLLVIAFLIALDGHGSPIFSQKRTGHNGKVFNIFKFRTMYVQECGISVNQVIRNDERITKLGQFLRKSSIDEFPQLLNIIKGEMSLIGPRPHALIHDVQFSGIIPNYDYRFCVRPGLTGLAQIKGYRGSTEELNDLEKRIAFDVEYIDNWSLWLDCKIFIATIFHFFDNDAY